MDNKYIYFTSEGTDSHSDFETQFSNTITISPYSQVRMISAHIKADNNQVEITSDNDTFYIGVDYWNKTGSTLPLLQVNLDSGIYNKDEFVEELTRSINGSLEPYAKFRDCVSVSIDKNTNVLTLTMKKKQLPSCPEQSLYNGVIESWNEANSLPFFNKNDVRYQHMKTAELDEPVRNNYYGVSIMSEELDPGPSFWIGPSMVTGLIDQEEGRVLYTTVIYLDQQTLAEGQYLQLWHGKCYERYLEPVDEAFVWGEEIELQNPDFKTSHKYCLQFMSDRLRVVFTDMSTGTPTVQVLDIDNDYSQNSEFTVTHYEWYDEVSSYWKVEISDSTNDLFSTTQRVSLESQKLVEDSDQVELAQNNVSLILNMTPEDNVPFIFISLNYDGSNKDHIYNGASNEFVTYPDRSTTYPLLTDGLFTDRPITIVSDTKNTNIDPYEVDYDLLFKLRKNEPYDEEGVYFDTYSLLYEPNTYQLNIFYKFNDHPYNGVLEMEAIIANASTMPQAYLEIRELPLSNYTGRYLQGSTQKFLSPIDFEGIGQDNTLYTSKAYTAQYLTLCNSSPMVLSSMRVRICDIDGVPIDLLPSTIVVIEIRDNPTLRKERQMAQYMKDLQGQTIKNPTVSSLQMLGTF